MVEGTKPEQIVSHAYTLCCTLPRERKGKMGLMARWPEDRLDLYPKIGQLITPEKDLSSNTVRPFSRVIR